jgi:hypothetical protein
MSAAIDLEIKKTIPSIPSICYRCKPSIIEGQVTLDQKPGGISTYSHRLPACPPSLPGEPLGFFRKQMFMRGCIKQNPTRKVR